MTNYTMKQAHRLQELAESVRDKVLTLKSVKEIAAKEFPELGVHKGRCDRELAYHVLINNAEATYERIEKGEGNQQGESIGQPVEPSQGNTAPSQRDSSKGQEVGYIRVSSVGQNTERQLDGIELDRVFEDKCSGSNTDRPQLQAMLKHVREGDTIHVHSIDRLARSLRDLGQIIDDLQYQGVSIHFHKNNLKFSGKPSPSEKLMLNMLGAFAEFEREIIRERQAEGIAKAKAKGKYQGRKPDTDRQERIRELKAEGKSFRKIAEIVGCSLSSVQRALK